MALINLTVNVDRLATAIETAIPVLARIAAALNRAYPDLLAKTPPTPAGPEAHFRQTAAHLRQLRQETPPRERRT